MKHARVARASWVWTLAATVVTIGCSAGGGGVIPDAHPVDAYEVSLDLPAGCPPPTGNEKQIGKPCTRGGNQCANDPNLHCTCDDFLTIRLEGVPCICTFVTVNSNPDAGDLCAAQSPTACGTNASCCAYMNIGTYCVPNICLPGGECPVVGAPPP
jgi:hypothetical protein